MSRYPRHVRRPVVPLDGTWDFAWLGETDPDTVDPARVRFDDAMAVPGCFDATPRYAGRRGLAAYRVALPVRDAARHRLVFEGVQHWCRLFADGERLRDHIGGFTRFAADLGTVAGAPREVELVVLVDNRDDPARTPTHRDYFDWYHYGGIARSVALHRLGDSWIDGVVATTVGLEPPAVRIAITYGTQAPSSGIALEIDLDGETVHAETVDLRAPGGLLERTLELPGTSLWSPADPNLHRLDVHLGGDDTRERIGLRQVRVEGRRVLVNDEPVRLVGVSRHEMHPDFGSALPESVVVGDVQLLQALGATMVRGGHYPQDPRFLDLCDEAGLLVWSEATGWQQTLEQLTDRAFLDVQRETIESMVWSSVNHPAVILWGLLNEGPSHDERCRPAYEELIRLIRDVDPTRPVTYAGNHFFDDVCLDLVDVVGVNAYPGWYFGEIGGIPEHLDRHFAHLEGGPHAHKPLIVSEIGAEGLPGWHDRHRDRWSEEHQADLLETALRHLLVDTDRACGVLVWVFADFRVPPEMPRMLIRAGAYNHKGVVDAWRRPKLATEVLRRYFSG